jgi:hypothetical protein
MDDELFRRMFPIEKPVPFVEECHKQARYDGVRAVSPLPGSEGGKQRRFPWKWCEISDWLYTC